MATKEGLPTKNFLTRLAELKLETGTTGSAKVRRIPLFSDFTTGSSIDTDEGNFDAIQHITLSDSVTDVAFYSPVILPIDFIRGGFPTLNYLASNSGTSGDVLWVVRVVSIVNNATSEVAILSDSTAITVNGVADTMVERSINFTVVPERNTILAVSIQRTGGDGSDTNSDETSLWAAWVEYLAYT